MRVFIGGSKEATDKGTVQAIAVWLEEDGHEAVRWDDPDQFTPAQGIFDGLLAIGRTVDAAVMVFAEDDRVFSRDTEAAQARDNVLIEFGLMAGALGDRNVVIGRYGTPKIPSDLSGIVYIDLKRPNTARTRLQTWLRNLTPKPLELIADRDRLYDVLYRLPTSVVKSARRDLVATGSRSRDLGYLNAIEAQVREMPSLAHIRVVFDAVRRRPLLDHVGRLLAMRAEMQQGDGPERIRVGIIEDTADLPERFICASETQAVLVLPSLTGIREYDTALLVRSSEAAKGYVTHVKNLFAASRPIRDIADTPFAELEDAPGAKSRSSRRRPTKPVGDARG